MGTYAVSGSASGIGGATRLRLERAGHRVIGIDRRDADVIADLSTPVGRDAAVGATLDACGDRLDGLCTAAGLGPPQAPELMVAVNYFGTVALLDGLRPALAATGNAQVVAVSSNSTTTSPNVPDDIVAACLAGDEAEAVHLAKIHDQYAAYPASKIGVARYVRRNAPTVDWAGSGVRLNAVAPGATLTPLLQAGLDSPDFGDAIRNFKVPTGEWASPDQIAFWIEQMLIGEGASFMCGSIVFVDGGTDAQIRPDDWPRSFHVDMSAFR